MAKIIGNTTATPNPRPDWNQTDETKADYIKNKPTVLTEEDVVDLISENGSESNVEVDQTFDPKSENAQSGIAVDQAISTKSQVQIVSDDITEILPTLKIHKVTQEQYDQAFENNTLENNAIYLTPDDEIDLSGYATIEQLNGKANAEHTHDDIYNTKAEISDSIATSLGTAKIYTDNAVSQKSQIQIVIWEADD